MLLIWLAVIVADFTALAAALLAFASFGVVQRTRGVIVYAWFGFLAALFLLVLAAGIVGLLALSL